MRPNILLILADDQGAWSMGCAGNNDVRTPNLDRLAREGTRFSHFFCASPVCSPARASLMTGKTPSQHGVHDWLCRGYTDESRLAPRLREAFERGDPTPKYQWPKSQLHGDHAIRFMDGHLMYSQLLADAGYDCALSGKWHLGDSALPQGGFRWWRSIAMGGDNYFTPTVLMPDGTFDMLDDHYITDYITENALDYLRNDRPADRPFYLSVHYTAPHSPFDRANHPAEFFEPFAGKPFASVPFEPQHPWSEPREDWPAYRQMCLEGYCAALYGMDKGVGQLLDALEELHLRENTLVIFTGDNGMCVGQHGVIGKGNGTFPMNMYEESVLVPMIARLPGVIPAGRVENGLYGHMDIFPTVAEFTGVPVPEGLCGQSLKKALLGQAAEDDGAVFLCDEYGPTRMVRTRDWKYIHRYPYGPHELYDLANDPHERVNLAGKPECAQVEAALRQQLTEFYVKYSDPGLDGSREAVYGKGQTQRVGVQAGGKPSFRPPKTEVLV